MATGSMGAHHRRVVPLAMLVVFQLGMVAVGAAESDRWDPRAAPSLELPKLAEPLKLDGDLSECGSALSVPLRYESFSPGAPWWKELRFAFPVARFMRQERIDIVHTRGHVSSPGHSLRHQQREPS